VVFSWHYRCHRQKYVAVKILTAHATQIQQWLADELGFLGAVRDFAGKSGNPGRNHVVALLNSFEISSAHGGHLCFVHETMAGLPMLGPLGLPLVIVVTKQQLLAFKDFLHREFRMIHTGTIHRSLNEVVWGLK
jgi:serine/threonine-protein kinase SRPK3